MIGRSVKNFFKNMRYLLYVLGVLFLALLFGGTAARAGYAYTEVWIEKIRENTFGTAALMALGILLIHGIAVFLTGFLSKIINNNKQGKKESEGVMIKESMKTYWKNMRYLIMVLGILFVTLLISTSVFARGTMETINAVATEVSGYIESNNLSFATIGPALEKGGNFFNELGRILGNFAGLAGTFIAGVGVGIIRIIGAGIAFVVIFIIGIFVSHDIVFIMARYNKENRGIMEAWFEIYVKDILIILYILVVVYFLSVPFLQIPGLVLSALFPVSYCFLSLLGEWLAVGKGRPKFTSVITAKNVLILFVENIIAMLISGVLGVIVCLLMGAIVGIFVGLALTILAAVSVSLNAQAFLFGENSWVNYIPVEDKKEIEENVEE